MKNLELSDFTIKLAGNFAHGDFFLPLRVDGDPKGFTGQRGPAAYSSAVPRRDSALFRV